MSMLGKMNYFLGLQIDKLKNDIFINQSKYCKELLQRFDKDNCKEMDTLMGSRTYVDQDKSGVSIDITKYRANPKEPHLTSIKRIMKYLKVTTNIRLWYTKGSICDLVGYPDSDYEGCKTDRKNTTGTCHILGNALVSWSYKKQACVVLSTAEAEYIAAEYNYKKKTICYIDEVVQVCPPPPLVPQPTNQEQTSNQ
ncbi:uncharacterized mitochondrial protein AtMg00810-like [Lathyrus oleraceus]|uniref:uncharacterized mitochondrial protein AtMg00810-like n=1 Tax=Pisum sativum TaxID=3888 RepID=UPI0021D12EEB|nr:uncharacterized mitochondrial protein AtMg00810-like [Pisum sativum]